jgi:large subunit ribosomal protein L2
MGKRIIQQARGHGSLTYRVRKQAYRFKIGYPLVTVVGKGKVVKLIDSAAHTAPLAKILIEKAVFYVPAFKNMVEGQEIEIGKAEKDGDIAKLKNIPTGTKVFNVEARPGDGGKFIRTSGLSAIITKKADDSIAIVMPSKKEIWFNGNCRATIGEIAGAGRKEKPFLKAGNKWYAMKSRNKLWPRTSAVKMNAIDHPFGSGRGKRIKSKIAKNNVPPGAKVGLIRPRRTGRRKR